MPNTSFLPSNFAYNTGTFLTFVPDNLVCFYTKSAKKVNVSSNCAYKLWHFFDSWTHHYREFLKFVPSNLHLWIVPVNPYIYELCLQIFIYDLFLEILIYESVFFFFPVTFYCARDISFLKIVTGTFSMSRALFRKLSRALWKCHGQKCHGHCHGHFWKLSRAPSKCHGHFFST